MYSPALRIQLRVTDVASSTVPQDPTSSNVLNTPGWESLLFSDSKHRDFSESSAPGAAQNPQVGGSFIGRLLPFRNGSRNSPSCRPYDVL